MHFRIPAHFHHLNGQMILPSSNDSAYRPSKPSQSQMATLGPWQLLPESISDVSRRQPEMLSLGKAGPLEHILFSTGKWVIHFKLPIINYVFPKHDSYYI